MDGLRFTPPATMDWWYRAFGREGMVEGRALRAYIQRLSRHLSEVVRVTGST